MRVLVTGGAGFIGSRTVRVAIEHGYEIVNIDSLTYAGSTENLSDISKNKPTQYQFFNVDICDGLRLKEIMEAMEPEAIMHLAAETHVDRSIDGPAQFINTNILGTATLLEVARVYYDKLSSTQQRRFRFHHVSTDEVYGSLGDSGAFTETSAYQPRSPYAASKASSDMLVRAWHHTYGLPTIVTNCSNNYGPYQYPEKLIPVVVLSALAGRPIPVYGSGRNVRDWLFVDDHADALLRVLQAGRQGETYNIGGSTELPNIEVVKAICTVLDELRPAEAPHSRLVTYVQDRPGHDFRYAIDDRKLREELGWTPRTAFVDGLRQTVAWYLANLDWCERRLGKALAAERRGLARRDLESANP